MGIIVGFISLVSYGKFGWLPLVQVAIIATLFGFLTELLGVKLEETPRDKAKRLRDYNKKRE